MRVPADLRVFARAVVCLMAGLPGAGSASAQAHHSPRVAAPTTVPAVLLSDLHFDPYHDPAKFHRLRAEPAEQWQSVLALPDGPTQAVDFQTLSAGCNMRGVDTPWSLLQSSLAAARQKSPHAVFVTVSGDLLAHQFDCRFRALAPGATDAEYTAFTEKTIAYVALELRRTFPQTPVYMTLGNNDSGCGDYREDPQSSFLRNTARSFAEDLASPQDSAPKDFAVQNPAAQYRNAMLQMFSANGDYSVRLPKPILRGRLLALQDIFLSDHYTGCDGSTNDGAAAAQLAWLRTELAAARAHHEQVWVMAHIPPGVDVYSTMTLKRDICGDERPTMFLRDEKLADVLTEFADVVRLSIFAHTHMDETHLLSRGPHKRVAAKLVPSISPINGNLPAFTLAEVDPRTATLKDFRVITGSSTAGSTAASGQTAWTEEYRYSTLFHRIAFDAAQVALTLDSFAADRAGTAQASTDYQQNVFAGGGKGSVAVHLMWRPYVCAMQHDKEAGFRACVCPKTP